MEKDERYRPRNMVARIAQLTAHVDALYQRITKLEEKAAPPKPKREVVGWVVKDPDCRGEPMYAANGPSIDGRLTHSWFERAPMAYAMTRDEAKALRDRLREHYGYRCKLRLVRITRPVRP